MNKITRNIPNAITCGNLLCGCFALVKTFEGDLSWASYLVGIAAVLDFFDGFAARILKVSSPIGKDLDSLADLVTFGVVPGCIMFQLLLFSTGQDQFHSFDWGAPEIPLWKKFLPFVAFMIPVFSAIRLARFNNDARQKESFIGLPVPANAIFFCSIPLINDQVLYKLAGDTNPFRLLMDTSSNTTLALTNNYVLLLSCVVLFSFLLVSPLKMFSLKFKSFSWKENSTRFIFIGISILLLILFRYVGIPLIIIFYILFSSVSGLFSKDTVG